MFAVRLLFPLALLAVLTPAIVPGADPAYALLDAAYQALRDKKLEIAIQNFERAAVQAPERASIRKDLAYTYLKVGEVERARDSFAVAAELDPSDEHVALEHAFLCYETKQQATARRIFDRIRRNGNQVAEEAFRNIDSELEEGINRWSRALELSERNFSAHQELARLAEQRDDLPLATRHYEMAWRLRPDLPELLVDLGRVWQLQGEPAKANAALLAASRGAQPRAAEAARELLPNRYPFVYEFQAALALDPSNVALRRELAYLHLAMGGKAEAEIEFRAVVDKDSADFLSTAQLGFLLLVRQDVDAAMPLLERVLSSNDDELADRVREVLKLPRALKKRPEQSRREATIESKELAERSLQAGYLKDALRYLRIAHENDPVDFNVILKLGWVHNILKDDKSALEWFRLARRSGDLETSTQAQKAYTNLRPAFQRFVVSAWAYPLFSSRWSDVFSYAQFKTEYKIPNSRARLYGSLRFTGDIRGKVDSPTSPNPVYLSESAFILGAGINMPLGKGAVAWGEAGRSFSYLPRAEGRSLPDYRGGVSWSRTIGKSVISPESGTFAQLNADAIYVHRFSKDTLFYSQNRWGYTLGVGSFRTQLYWNTNITADLRRLYWANTFEQGPGIRFRLSFLPESMYVHADSITGRYLIKEDNPLGAGFKDFRIGLWYAFSR